MPVRGFYGTHVFNNATVDRAAVSRAAALAPLAKQGMLVLDLDQIDSSPRPGLPWQALPARIPVDLSMWTDLPQFDPGKTP